MKYCDACSNTYPDEFAVCPADQNTLRSVNTPPPGTVIRGRREVIEAVAVTRGWNPKPAASPPPKALPSPDKITPKQILIFVGAALALVVGTNLAYRIHLSRQKPAPAIVVSDQDLTEQVQQKLASSALFTNDTIAVVVDHGVVTLSGTVREDWKRISAPISPQPSLAWWI